MSQMDVGKASSGKTWATLSQPTSITEVVGFGHKCKPTFKLEPNLKLLQMNECSGLEFLSPEETLISLQRITHPSVECLICILQSIRKEKNLAFARCLHVHVGIKGLEAHRELGNYLVPMLVECGSLPDARQVFLKLARRNEHSWTSLIQGHIECGEFQHALDLYQRMQQDSIHPSKYTLQAMLKCCARLNYLERGREIHCDIVKEEFERDPFVGSSLVDMYAKGGSLSEAREVFDELHLRNVVTWNALILGYAEHGPGEEALKCFESMCVEGMSPDAVTFISSLKACGSTGAIRKAQEIHSEIVKEGFEGHPFSGNTLVDTYGKCGLLAEAQEVFDELPTRDAVSWSALIAGYAERGLGKEALSCWEKMLLERVPPNSATFVGSLKACGNLGALYKGQEIHREIVEEGFESNLFISSILVDMYAKCGSLAEAQAVFDELPVRNVVSWSALMAGYAEHGFGKEALTCWEKMQLEGVAPNAITCICSLKACATIGAICRGREIHDEIIKEGFERDLFVSNTLVYMYAKCSALKEARDVLYEMRARDVVSWNALIAGCAEHGLYNEVLTSLDSMQSEGILPDAVTFICSLKACSSIGTKDRVREIHFEIAKEGFEFDSILVGALVDVYAKNGLLAEAQEVFDEVPLQDIVSWSALIAGYAEHGCGEEALHLFEKMQVECGPPDDVTFLCSLKACISIGALHKGQEIHVEIIKEGFESDSFVGNTLVVMYAKCGSLVEAQEMFDELPIRIVMSWNALIAGYACKGESEPVFWLFERMRAEGVQPDGITFLNVLSMCNHVGLVDKGHKYFELISKEYGIIPTIEHHNSIVDLLGRAGQINEAVATLDKMPFQPNPVVCNTVLAACQKWGNVELGTQVFECAERLNEKQSFPFVLISNQPRMKGD